MFWVDSKRLTRVSINSVSWIRNAHSFLFSSKRSEKTCKRVAALVASGKVVIWAAHSEIDLLSLTVKGSVDLIRRLMLTRISSIKVLKMLDSQSSPFLVDTAIRRSQTRYTVSGKVSSSWRHPGRISLVKSSISCLEMGSSVSSLSLLSSSVDSWPKDISTAFLMASSSDISRSGSRAVGGWDRRKSVACSRELLCIKASRASSLANPMSVNCWRCSTLIPCSSNSFLRTGPDLLTAVEDEGTASAASFSFCSFSAMIASPFKRWQRMVKTDWDILSP